LTEEKAQYQTNVEGIRPVLSDNPLNDIIALIKGIDKLFFDSSEDEKPVIAIEYNTKTDSVHVRIETIINGQNHGLQRAIPLPLIKDKRHVKYILLEMAEIIALRKAELAQE
jgi:hypothetical protein